MKKKENDYNNTIYLKSETNEFKSKSALTSQYSLGHVLSRTNLAKAFGEHVSK